MKTINAYGAANENSSIAALKIERRDVGSSDVEIEILYCGVCHTDIHQVKNDWGGSHYPIVPGHEIVGKITSVGVDVEKFNVDDIVGVGCMVDSCQDCAACDERLEQYCENGFTPTYNGKDDKHNTITYGGYADSIVVDEKFVLSIPDNLELKSVAPLLCAGITTYSPLIKWNIKPGDTVGVVGLGGLGHMAVKLAHAMGANVVMVTTSNNKGEDAKKLGADSVLLSTDDVEMQANVNRFSFIINTIPVKHDLNPYLNLLKCDGTMVIVGAVESFDKGQLNGGSLIRGRKRIAGSLIGGIKETQEMLDFCGTHNILPEIEMINPDEINHAYERMQKNNVKYRFVIDMSRS